MLRFIGRSTAQALLGLIVLGLILEGSEWVRYARTH